MSNYLLSRETEIFISLVTAGVDIEEAKREASYKANYEREQENLKAMKCKIVQQQRMQDEYVNEEIKAICTDIYLKFLSSGCTNKKLKILINYLIDCEEIDGIKLDKVLVNVVTPEEINASSILGLMLKFNFFKYQRTFDDIRFKIISELIKIYIKYADINKEEK